MKSIKQLGKSFLAFAATATMLMQPVVLPTLAQAQEANDLHLKGLSHTPSKAANAALLDPNDAVFLFLDHQTGLFQTVNDISVSELRANTVALAKIAEQADIPIIYTASEPDGPNGPIMEELPAAMPSAQYVPRQGEVSSWDNADFVEAVKETGKKTLVILDS